MTTMMGILAHQSNYVVQQDQSADTCSELSSVFVELLSVLYQNLYRSCYKMTIQPTGYKLDSQQEHNVLFVWSIPRNILLPHYNLEI